MQAGYRLRAARKRDLATLPEIEHRAGLVFADAGLPEVAESEGRAPEEFAGGLAQGGLWVAVDAADRPVGFALVVELASGPHLEEIDVDPDHARRGIGTALIEHVCRTARRRGHEHVTLTTYVDVPWNAPFYERLGFRVLARGEIGPDLERVVAHEASHVPSASRRVVMRRRVSRSGTILRWTAGAWLLGIVALSAIASERPLSVLQFTRLLPGRDKTAHFLLMGGFAFFAVLAFARRHQGDRRVPTGFVLVGVALVVFVEEGLQWWLPLRNFSLFDLAWSLGGVAVFGGSAALWRVLRARRHRSHEPAQRYTS